MGVLTVTCERSINLSGLLPQACARNGADIAGRYQSVSQLTLILPSV